MVDTEDEKSNARPPDLVEQVRAAVRAELAAAARREAAPDPLLTEADVADLLGVSARTMQTMRAAGEIQSLRVRSAVRYTRAAVESYIRRRAKAGAGEGSDR